MNRLQMLVAASLGGALAGGLFGLLESLLLAVLHPAPDQWMWVYALLIYAMLGAVLGTAGALVASPRRAGAAAQAGFFGALAAWMPVGGFVLRYTLNKEVYAEQGVPVPVLFGASGLLLIAGCLPAWALWRRVRTLGVAQTAAQTMGWGAVISVAAVALAVLAPVSDPRTQWVPAQAGAERSPQGGILILLVDTLRADHLGAYGAPFSTPNFDRIARDGILFEQAYAAASWTRASGASLMTSRLPSGHGASAKASVLSDDAVTYAEVLRDGGFTNGALINNINLTQTFHFDQGFDAFVYEAPEYRFGATESVFGLTLYKVVHKLAERVDRSERVERFYQPARVVFGDALRFVEAHRGKPWSLMAHLMEPHDPYFEHPSIRLGEGHPDYNGSAFGRAEVEHPRPEQVDELKALYADEVRFLDRELGVFLDQLERSGLYDELTIVVTADHGEEFYEHGGFWHGTTLYDEQIHVPLLVKLPNRDLAGTRVPWQVRLIDVAPTMASIAGVTPPAGWEGEDLLPSVRRWLLEASPPVAAPCTPHPLERPVIAEQDFEGNQIAALRAGGMKWIRANEGNPRGLPTASLFDVVVDAGENANLAAGEGTICGAPARDRAAALDAQLGAALAESGRGAAKGGEAVMGEAECERLKALGYLGADEPCR